MSDHMARSAAANATLLRGRINGMLLDIRGAQRLLPDRYTLSDDTRADLWEILEGVQIILNNEAGR